VDPLHTSRPYLELYVRWMQEDRRYAPSTVSRRLSTVAGFYRTCVIDGVFAHSPAEHVRRPPVTTLSPTLGLSHLQFEAILNIARLSPNPNDFALVCLLGLLGLRIMEATGLDIEDLGEEHGDRVVRVLGQRHQGRPDRDAARRGPRGRSRRRRRIEGRSCATATAAACNTTPPPAGCVNCRSSPACVSRGCTRTCCGTPSSPPCLMPASICATPRSRPGTPTRAPPVRARTNLDRHPNYVLAAYLSSAT
jgi:hypothetical protein